MQFPLAIFGIASLVVPARQHEADHEKWHAEYQQHSPDCHQPITHAQLIYHEPRRFDPLAPLRVDVDV